MANLRSFGMADWNCFSGCTTKNPEIADVGKWVIILDGQTVELTYNCDEAGETDVYAFTYGTTDRARWVAELLSQQDADNLQALLRLAGFQQTY